MNDLFINIKVDREERPDLDKIYQTALICLTRRNGGWPLTMILNPTDHTPFFAGTYFPSRRVTACRRLLIYCRRVAGFYHERADELKQQDDSVKDILARLQPPPSSNSTG